jgi:hypothetical protein
MATILEASTSPAPGHDSGSYSAFIKVSSTF